MDVMIGMTDWPPNPPWVIIVIFGLIGIADGCIRRATVQPTDPPTITTTLSPTNKKDCTMAETSQTGCLNGGSCFALELNDGLRSIGCACTEDWIGDRCQYKYIDPGILEVREENMRTANIAAGVSVCILVVFVALLIVYVYIKLRRGQHSSELQSNGTAIAGVNGMHLNHFATTDSNQNEFSRRDFVSYYSPPKKQPTIVKSTCV